MKHILIGIVEGLMLLGVEEVTVNISPEKWEKIRQEVGDKYRRISAQDTTNLPSYSALGVKINFNINNNV